LSGRRTNRAIVKLSQIYAEQTQTRPAAIAKGRGHLAAELAGQLERVAEPQTLTFDKKPRP
jgi:hypothetical protein